MEPFIDFKMSNEDYHSMEGLSSTNIKQIIECPRKFFNKKILGLKQEDKKYFIKGTAFHKFLLENNSFFEEYEIVETLDLRKKADKELYKSIKESGKTPIIEKDMKEIEKMSLSLMDIPVINKVMRQGTAESSIFWKEKNTKELLKCRPDYFTDDFIIDLKSTKNASPDSFSKDVIKYNYHVQAAMYLDGLSELTGNTSRQFMFIAAEGYPDFICEWYVLDENLISLGRDLYKSAINLYQKMVSKNKWPTYCSKIEDHQIFAPIWAYDKLEKLNTMEV